MVLEALTAALVGAAGLWLVLQPIFAPGQGESPPVEPLDPEDTPRGIALAALKEIDFDRETGKLSDSDYAYLKSKYTQAALDALRSETPEAQVPASPRGQLPRCQICGIRPEPDAIFCSTCGRRLARSHAAPDAAPLPESARTASA